jgi:hypothetical protein
MSASEIESGLRKIGEYLPCPQSDIDWALSVQAMESALGNSKRLGEILIGREDVTHEVLAGALESQLIDRLRLSSLLEDLSRDTLARIGRQTDQIELEPGETLFQEGFRGDSMYVLLRGRLILSCSIEQKEFPAGAVIPGDVLGERECFTDGTRSYSAYATESSELLKIRYNLIPKNENKVAEDTAQFSPAQIAQRARAVLRADRVFLFLQDVKTGDLITQTGDGSKLREFRIAAGTDIVGWVALKREIINLREAYLDPRFDPGMDIQTGYWTRTLLAAPVVDTYGEVLGVVLAVNKNRGWFDSDDEALLHALATQYADALCLKQAL